jgi:hypothetical protein
VTLETPFAGPCMRGRDLGSRRLRQAEQIITQVAHPRVRGELREAGRALGFRV